MRTVATGPGSLPPKMWSRPAASYRRRVPFLMTFSNKFDSNRTTQSPRRRNGRPRSSHVITSMRRGCRLGRDHKAAISMYKVPVPIFVQLLTALSAVLDKAAAHAEAKQLDPAFLLNMRALSRHVSAGAAGAVG